MTAQEWITYGLGLLALAYLVSRFLRRRRAGTCCGQPECPVARQVVRNLGRARERAVRGNPDV